MGNIYAVVVDGVVVNLVVWDGISDWKPVQGEAVLTDGDVGIGWGYVNGEFINPEPPEITIQEQPK